MYWIDIKSPMYFISYKYRSLASIVKFIANWDRGEHEEKKGEGQTFTSYYLLVPDMTAILG